MDENKTKIMYILLVFSVFTFALTFIKDPSITGHVLVDAGYQPLDLYITESQSYTVTTDYVDPLTITFIRMSGEIIGDGKAEIILDNGLGQRLTIYSNIDKPHEPNLITGMDNKITGMAIAGESDEVDKKALLNLIPHNNLAYSNENILHGEKFKSGAFANECVETCLINMELSEEASYVLEFRVSKGTEMKLDNMMYGILLG